MFVTETGVGPMVDLARARLLANLASVVGASQMIVPDLLPLRRPDVGQISLGWCFVDRVSECLDQSGFRHGRVLLPLREPQLLEHVGVGQRYVRDFYGVTRDFYGIPSCP